MFMTNVLETYFLGKRRWARDLIARKNEEKISKNLDKMFASIAKPQSVR